MGFLSKLFKKKKHQENDTDDWETVVYDRDDVDFSDEEERSRYIANCLEQMGEATREMNLLTGEYSLITSHLTDMEEIEALPAPGTGRHRRAAGGPGAGQQPIPGAEEPHEGRGLLPSAGA